MLYFVTTQEQQMQNSVASNSLWIKLITIMVEGGLIGALVGLLVRGPGEPLEFVMVTTLFGLGLGWTIADFIRLRHGHSF